ncbi:MAG: isoleucine--tRNA ligase [Chthonomonadales bacterium]
MEYKQTLNITLSDKHPGAMPQRGNLPEREPEIEARWEEIDLYKLSLEKPAPRGTFILHDGPPYSNGNIHLGHALNKLAKDIIVKYKTMQGYCSPYVPGWDNHGMPIENEVSKEFRKKGEKPDKVTMRKRCREYAAGFVNIQREQFKRLGVRGDWNNPYLTMSPDFEAKIVQVFGELAAKGFVYRGLKPVMWCAFCETALADAEIEYENHTSNSIFVRFPVQHDPNNVFGLGDTEPANAYVLIWTTTPWTIPANVALAVHPDEEYVIAQVGEYRYLLAGPLLEKTLSSIYGDGVPGYFVLSRHKGSDLEGLVARHPLFHRTSVVVSAPYVTMEDGTGVVHTAPGHGKEDFETGVKYGLEVLCPVSPDGAYTKQAGDEFVGKRILGGGADEAVLAALEVSGNLLKRSKFEHSYPHCWRCHNPLLFRATVQWFMNIDHDGHRQKSLDAIQQTKWYPPVSINRIGAMVANRPDWCLSRQRAWGVPIPAFYCKDCGSEIISGEAVDHVVKMVAEETSDVWYAKSAEELLPTGFVCPKCGHSKFEKETDILDVWFDSGSTHRAVLENTDKWPHLKWPADVYLEGSDQHRGWFNSSLMVGVSTSGRAPFDAVITNGWTLDENGKAMHKSLGNAVSPDEVTQKYGADILRLWVASCDYFEDVRCSDAIIGQVAETYRRIRNTLRFMVNNLHDFDGGSDMLPIAFLQDLDQWALAKLDALVEKCTEGYNAFEFHGVYHAVNNFCAVEMSAFYMDVIKDRLYCSGVASPERRSAQTALYLIATTLAQVLAPVLSHTADEAWEFLGRPGDVPSAQLTDFPTTQVANGPEQIARWEPVLQVREVANIAVEAARQAKTIGNPLEAAIQVTAPESLALALRSFGDELASAFKVSQVSVLDGETLSVEVFAAEGVKCARCWLMKQDVGVDGTWEDLCGRCAAVVATLPEAVG